MLEKRLLSITRKQCTRKFIRTRGRDVTGPMRTDEALTRIAGMFSRTVVNAGVNEDVQKEGVRNELSDRSAPARTLRCINLHVPDARRTCHSVCAHLTHARINTLDYALASDSQKQAAIHFAKDLPNMMSLLTADIKLVGNILIKLQLISWYRYNPDYIRISSIKDNELWKPIRRFFWR